MAGSHVPQFANLPEYAGPGLPTRARNVVKALTELPERFIEYVDENVAASKEDPRCLRVVSTDETRTTTRFTYKRLVSTWSRLLDQDGGDPDRASRWKSVRLLPEGSLVTAARAGSLLKQRPLSRSHTPMLDEIT